ncbi:MAG TPA: phosphodiester glycosidase family protein [Blastocatellia bacterium]|nr:phosphodiester glycosidase family protein [Blastocatellia bacterium]
MRDQAITKQRSTIARDLSYSFRLLNLTGALFFLLNTGLSLQANPGPNGQQQAAHVFQPVAPGVEHLKVTRGAKSDNEATGPWVINLLRIDPAQVDLRIAHALDEGVGLETTSSIAARAGAIAAVNAGFFRTTGTYRGESSGVLAIGRNLLSEPIEGRAAFGLIRHPKSTEIIFGHLKFSGYVEPARGLRHVINGVNRPRSSDELIMFTPAFHRTTLTNPDGVEAIIQRNEVVRVRDQTGSTMIPANGVVISAAGTAREWVMANLRTGSRVRIQTKLVPIETEMTELWSRASFIVGGGPQLIKGGLAAITTQAEGIASRFATDRHPRTAIAKLKDGGILLATVDGRQPGVSAGMSLSELAGLLLEFGAAEAINLDGGGSTTMVISGKLVNMPSDPTGERPVSDAILIIARPLLSKPRID